MHTSWNQFSLSNKGKVAVKSHASGIKHENTVKWSQATDSVSQYFQVWKVMYSRDYKTVNCLLQCFVILLVEPWLHSSVTTSATKLKHYTKGSWQPTNKICLEKEAAWAEMLLVLKYIMSYFSYNSASHITDIFKSVFQDSAITQSMTLHHKTVLSDQL